MNKIKRTKKVLSILFLLFLLISFVLLIYEFRNVIIEAIEIGSWTPITEKFSSYGFWGIFFVSLTQTLIILMTVFPGSPIQIISAISLGYIKGFIACIIGIFVGNLAIYLFSKRKGSKSEVFYENEELEKIEKVAETRGKRFFSWFIIFLYLIPVFPYGLIAFTAAKSKMKYPRYFLLTTIGAIPSTILNIALGTLLMQSSYKMMIFLMVVFLLLTFLVARYHQRIINYLTRRPIKDMVYFQRSVRRPGAVLYPVLRFFVKLYFFPKAKVKVKLNNLKEIKGPYLLVFNHPSKLDFAYSFIPVYPKKVNSIVAYYYFCNYKLGRLLHRLGGFPKFLYQPDISSIKNIKRVIREQGILGIAPEGRLSAYGCLESFAPATEKLVKHLAVPVVMAKINGAYLTYPKWAKKMRRGLVEVEYKQILSSDDIKRMSTEEIYDLLYQKLDYDDFKWQEEKQIYYKGKKFAEGLEQILYLCPLCHNEFTIQSASDMLHCTACGVEVKLNHYYQFESSSKKIPKNIRDWYLFQKEFEKERIQAEDYQLESKVTLKFPDPAGKGFSKVGEGLTIFNHHGIKYIGSINGEEKIVDFKIENLPVILFGVNEDFEIYQDNTLYYFVPENIRECVKWSVVGEAMYNKYRDENK